MSWDKISAEEANFLRTNLPGLRPVPGRLKTRDLRIDYIEALSDKSVGVGWVDEGDCPENSERYGVYGLEELRIALEFAEAFGAESVYLVEGPRSPGYPRLVLLCEDKDGFVGRRCVIVAPQDPEVGQREVV